MTVLAGEEYSLLHGALCNAVPPMEGNGVTDSIRTSETALITRLPTVLIAQQVVVIPT